MVILSHASLGSYPHPAFTLETDDSGVLRFCCSNALRDALAEAFGKQAYVSNDETAVLARAKTALVKILGPWGVEVLMKVQALQISEGLVVIENLPFEKVDWAPVPGQPARSAKSTDTSELLLLAFGSLLGQPFSIASEGPRLVNDLIPAQKDLHALTGNGSRTVLDFHAESIFLKFILQGMDWSPMSLLLTGVSEQIIGGPTTPVALAARAMKLVAPTVKKKLRTACVRITVTERQRASFGGPDSIGPVPVVMGPDGCERIYAAFYNGGMEPMDKEAENALAELEAAIRDVAINLTIRPGMLAYIANGPTLHARSQFEPQFNENGQAKRWIQRLLLTGRLDEFCEAVRITERVLDLKR